MVLFGFIIYLVQYIVYEYGLLGSIYHCTLATCTLIVFVFRNVKIFKKKKNKQNYKIFFKKNL
jgi:hypothetical protein